MTSLSRRHFLAGSGLTVLGASLCRSLIAGAQSGPPKRLLIVHRPNGSVGDQFFPSDNTETSFQLPYISSPFEPVKSDMMLLGGFDLPIQESWTSFDSHGMGIIAMMTGTKPVPIAGFGPAPEDVHIAAGGISIDQIFASQAAALKGNLKPSIQLAGTALSSSSAGDAGPRCMSYAGSGANGALFPETRPDVALANIFGGFTPSANPAPTGPDPAQARAAQFRKGILDQVAADVTRLRARIPVSQRPKLDEHLTAIQGLAAQVSGGGTAGGGLGCAKPTLGGLVGNGDEAVHAETSRQMLKIINSSFACDLTRIATFQFAPALSELQFAQVLPQDVKIQESHHTISHTTDAAALTARARIDRFYAERLAEALVEMKNTPDGPNTTLLDNTLVVYFNEIDDGEAHGSQNICAALFGGKSWGLQGGRHVALGRRSSRDFWSTVAQHLSVPLPQFGETTHPAMAPIAALFS